ncbi:MAG: 50S ribosomal protein L15 [Candidatus Omnitrophota bacterium]|jgi:large subunit ribosomal protein L15
MDKKKIKSKKAAVILTGINNIKAPAGSHKRKKILGRGTSSGHGKTSTRGSKGQTSRSGKHKYLGFEGGQTPLIRRLPKRGFISRFKKEYQLIHLEDLNRIKEQNISLQILKEKGLIKDTTKLVKILSDGELKNPVTVQAHAVSKKAFEKIKSAGGNVELIAKC